MARVDTQERLAQTWFAVPDDLIGGWCVMPVNKTPSQAGPGEYPIAEFMEERMANHVANLHNSWLFLKRNR